MDIYGRGVCVHKWEYLRVTHVFSHKRTPNLLLPSILKSIFLRCPVRAEMFGPIAAIGSLLQLHLGKKLKKLRH